MRSSISTRVAVAAALSLLLVACGSTTAPGASSPTTASGTTSAPETSPSAPEASASAPEASATTAPAARSGFVSLAEYQADQDAFAAGDVVLFFHASWCPKCQETKDNLQADPASLPAGLTVVEVDFDAEQDLRARYGVTVQHTFVQVDPTGEQVAVWTGTYTGQDIAAKVV